MRTQKIQINKSPFSFEIPTLSLQHYEMQTQKRLSEKLSVHLGQNRVPGKEHLTKEGRIPRHIWSFCLITVKLVSCLGVQGCFNSQECLGFKKLS